MIEWKTIVASSVVAGGISWLATSYQIKQELYSRQGEAGYEALIEANTLFWQSEELLEEAKREKDATLLTEAARKLRRKSDASYHAAQHKIAAFGDERVVKAMSDYYKYDPKYLVS